MEYVQIDEWLFEECYYSVGDLVEIIVYVLLLFKGLSDLGLVCWMEECIVFLCGVDFVVICIVLFVVWDELDWQGCFLFVKLIGGGFWVGVLWLLVMCVLVSVV